MISKVDQMRVYTINNMTHMISKVDQMRVYTINNMTHMISKVDQMSESSMMILFIITHAPVQISDFRGVRARYVKCTG